MKKLFLFILACLPLLTSAQTYDTISGPNGRYHKYYYSSWFDSCGVWNDTQTRAENHDVPGNLFINYFGFESWSHINPFGGPGNPPASLSKLEYVPQVSAMKGVAVVTTDKNGHPLNWRTNHPVTEATSDTMAPDTCFVFKVVNGEMDIIGYARWDTATPKIYKVPLHEDSVHAGFVHLKVFEVYFKTPVEVNDTFYIAGTPYNQEIDGNHGYYLHPPHHYAKIEGHLLPDDPCVPPDPYEQYIQEWLHPTGYQVTFGREKPTLSRHIKETFQWGAFFPILSYDSVWLRAQSADREMGVTTPTGRRVLQWVTHTIRAVPRTGYKFTHWNDGNTDNPRQVLMDKDSVFTAYFAPKEQYHIAVGVDNPEHGYATGGGTYYELDTVRMEAFPSSDRFQFDFWGDGNVSNPRYMLARCDTSFIAFFKDLTAIDTVSGNGNLFTLTPNPATGTVTVTVGHTPQSLRDSSPNLGEQLILTLTDAAGREVLRKELSTLMNVSPDTGSQFSIPLDLSNLPAGAYFVTLSTPASSATQRLVVK